MDDKEAVIDLAQRVPRAPELAELPPGVDPVDLASFSTRTGLIPPREFEEWLAFTNGPCIGPGGLLGIHPEANSLDIEGLLSIFPSWATRGWIPVAGDGSGNYFVLDSRRSSGDRPVYFVDTHEDPDKPAYVVATGLWKFLRFLLAREMGDTGWPFSKEVVLSADPLLENLQGTPLPWKS